MTAFRTPVDIANRALQQCGANPIATADFSEISKNSSEISACYDKLREAELDARFWTFAIRRAALRAIDSNTMLLSPSLWMPGVTYFRGSMVADEEGSLWISNIPSNLANDPLLTTFWAPYFGPMTVSLFDSTNLAGYYAGELVYTAAGDGTNRVYLSLISGNSDTPSTATAWSATTTYFQNQIVTFNSVAYMSLVDLNLNKEPDVSPTQWTTSFVGGAGSLNWLEIGGAEFPNGAGLATLNIVYPIGSGPSTSTFTPNVYRLPAGYMRRAPQNPKPGVSNLGGPSGVSYDDWLIEGDYLVSSDLGPILLRFVANLTDVSEMRTVFCEGLALRIGVEVCQVITQSSQKAQEIASKYQRWNLEARTIDGIEEDFRDPPDDDYLSVRL